MPEISPELLQKIKVILETVGDEKAISSLKDLRNKVKELSAVPLKESAGDLQKYRQALNDVNQTVKAANTPFDQLLKSNQQMSNAVLNMNYVIRDSPYFMRNFGMGIMAIGNNLNPLIDSMIRANASAKELGMTFTQALTKSLVGAGGVMFAMSLAVAAFQAIVFAMEGSKRKAKELTESFEDQEKQLYKTIESLERYKVALPGYEDIEKALKDAKKLSEAKKEERDNSTKRIEKLKLERDAVLASSMHDVSWMVRKQELNKQIRSEIRNFDALNAEYKLLIENELNLLGSSKRYNELTTIGEKVLKSKSIVTKEYIKNLKLTGDETDALTGYISDQREKLERLGDQYTVVGKSLEMFREERKKTEREPKERYFLEELQAKFEKDRMDALKKLRDMREDFHLKAISDEEEKEIASFKKTLRDKQIELGDYFSSCIITEEEYLTTIGLMNEDATRAIEDIKKKWFDKRLNEQLKEEEKAQRELIRSQREQLQIQKDQVQAALQLVSAMGQLGGKTDSFLGQLANVLRMIIMIKSIMDSMKIGKAAGGMDETTGYLGILATILSMFHTGGIVKAHGGMLARDEVPIIAQRGEMILTQSQQANMFNQLKYGGGSSQKIYLNVDSKTIMEFVVKPRLLKTLGELQRTRSN